MLRGKYEQNWVYRPWGPDSPREQGSQGHSQELAPLGAAPKAAPKAGAKKKEKGGGKKKSPFG